MSSLSDSAPLSHEEPPHAPAGGEEADAIQIPIAGQMTRQDYLRAHRLFYKPSLLDWAFRLVLVALLAAIYAQLHMLWVGLLLSAILIAMPWWLPYFSALTQWPSNAPFHEPWRGEATAQRLRFEGAHFSSDAAWEIYLKHKRSAEVVLLYVTSRSMQIIPKSLFASESDWQGFLALVESKVPSKAPPSGNATARVGGILWRALAILVLVFLLARSCANQPEEEEEEDGTGVVMVWPGR